MLVATLKYHKVHKVCLYCGNRKTHKSGLGIISIDWWTLEDSNLRPRQRQ